MTHKIISIIAKFQICYTILFINLLDQEGFKENLSLFNLLTQFEVNNPDMLMSYKQLSNTNTPD